MSKNKKKATGRGPISPKKYIIEKARGLPVFECLINEGWQKNSMVHIFVVRKMPSGNYIIGTYLVDIMCLGLKDSYFYFNMFDYEWSKKKEEFADITSFYPCDYALVHNVIYGAIDFALEAGINPAKEFAISKYILEKDSEEIETDEIIEFGENGVHHYMPNEEESNIKQILYTLNKNLGEDSYFFTSPFGFEREYYKGRVDDEDYYDDEEEEEEDETYDDHEEVDKDTEMREG